MDLYVLDTDILTLFERGSETVLARVEQYDPVQIAISVVTFEEQLSGWYAQVRQAKDSDRLAWAYGRLADSVRFLSRMRILEYDVSAIARYDALKRRRLNVRKMDLQIAATVLERDATLVTRNVRDFKRVPGLCIQDWSK